MGYHSQVLAAKIGTTQAPVIVAGDKLGARADAAIQKQWRRIQALIRSKKPGYWVFREKLKKLIDEMLLAGIDTLQDGLEKIAIKTSKATQDAVFGMLPDGYKNLLITEDKATPDQERQIKSMLFDPMKIDDAKKIVEAPTAGLGWKSRIIQQTKLGDPAQIANAVVNWRASGQTPKALEQTLLPMLQGVRTSARRVARTEAARVAQMTRMSEYEQLGDLVVGYQIHATMDSHTRPHHAARSGEIYYKSPKQGQKAITAMPHPPHEPDGTVAHNCRCYLTPVMDIQVHIENDPAAKAIFADAEKELVPDPLVYQQWFKSATPQEQHAAVGKRRYQAVLAKLPKGEVPGWEHFLDPKTGQLLSISQLQEETPEELAKRLQAVRMLLTRRKGLAKAVATFGYVPPKTEIIKAAKIKAAIINVAGMTAPITAPSIVSTVKQIIAPAPNITQAPNIAPNTAPNAVPVSAPAQITLPLFSGNLSFPTKHPVYGALKNDKGQPILTPDLLPPNYTATVDMQSIILVAVHKSDVPSYATYSGRIAIVPKNPSPAPSVPISKPIIPPGLMPNKKIPAFKTTGPVYKWDMGKVGDYSVIPPNYSVVADGDEKEIYIVPTVDVPPSAIKTNKIFLYYSKSAAKTSILAPTTPSAPAIPKNIIPAKPPVTLPEKKVKNFPPPASTGQQTLRSAKSEMKKRLTTVLKNKSNEAEHDPNMWNVPTIPGAPKPAIGLTDSNGNHKAFVPHNDLSLVVPVSRFETRKDFPSLKKLTQGKRLGGSTGADLVTDETGKKWVRKLGASRDHIQSEADADALYAALGVPVPASKLYNTGGALTKIAEHIEGETLDKKFSDPDVQKKIQANFAADALLGNWDVVGMSADNIIVGKDGTPYRIDNGGALNFRAQGQKKTSDQWDAHPTELWSMSDPRNATKSDAQGKAAQIYGQMPWMDTVEQMEKIVKSKNEILKATPAEHKDILEKRIEQMRDIAATSRMLVDDGFDPEYAKDFTRHQQNLRRLKITGSLPKRLGDFSLDGMQSGNVEVRDENGKLFDSLRDYNGITDQWRKYMEANGGDWNEFVEYGEGQGLSSNSKPSNKFKLFMQSVQPGADFSRSYAKHKAADKKKFMLETGLDEQGYQKYRTTMSSMHALTSELLRNTDMLGNNRAQGFVSVYRTETKQAFKDQSKLQAERWDSPNNIPSDEFNPGIAESYASFRTVQVHNEDLIQVEVPHHRVFSSYLFGRRIGYVDAPTFLENRENELIVMAHGYGAKSWGSAEKLFASHSLNWKNAHG